MGNEHSWVASPRVRWSVGSNGANRLPGNALEETQVSAVIAGKSAAEYAKRISLAEIDKGQIEAEKEPCPEGI